MSDTVVIEFDEAETVLLLFAVGYALEQAANLAVPHVEPDLRALAGKISTAIAKQKCH